MSLKVEQLTKFYGQQVAVNHVSFTINEGEIVGFLGPNGAGKSTTMKIITGFLPPDAGKVEVAGFNVVSEPLKVKQITGYLPEHNPLYLDMYVHEYLSFMGGLYGLRKNLKQRVGEMIAQCGLEREQNKKIEALSKGYRQRVGLAQALIHDPRVLILDEPTSGLDPNQILEIRKLIKEISHNKTVVFSTHIMQEVEALCDRVIVINKGDLVADDSLSNLVGRNSQTFVVIAEFDGMPDASIFNKLAGAISVQQISATGFKISSNNKDIRSEIFRFAADHRLSLIGLKQQENSLETIFQALTR
jgi:ABC-2 type transport system ATP-binding protein